MPTAAADIEDIMLSACSSGYAESADYRTGLQEWRTVFPNLKTLWGYGGAKDFHSPTGDAALSHITAWERATRGRAERLDPRAAVAQTHGHLVGYEGNVSWWSSKQGYVQGK